MSAGVILLVTAAAGAADEEARPLVFAHRPSPPCPTRTFELAFVGDVIVHGMQLEAARRPDGSYRFDGVLEGVAPWLRAADLAVANLETTMAGEDHGGYTGFPLFNTPESLLDELRAAGIDVLQLANNHCLDRGVEGVHRTIDAVERHGFLHAGTFRSPEARERPWILLPLPTGARIAFLAYTFSTNAPQMPADQPWLIGITDLGRMDRDIVLARREADFVIVGMHWGLNYSPTPVPWSERLGRRLVDAGADLIVGHHPHVLERAEVLEARDPLGNPRDALVLYSLGNFLSNQREPRQWGAVIAHVQLTVCTTTGATWLSGVRFTPFYVDDRLDDGTVDFRVVPAPRFGAACVGAHLDEGDCERMRAERDHAAAVFWPGHLSWEVREPEVPWVDGFDWSGTSPWGFRWMVPFRPVGGSL